MNEPAMIDPQDIDRTLETLEPLARRGGYYLNPDTSFIRDLIRGMLVNEHRYGYQACPCRLAEGKREKDIDIICPCYYRDADVLEYGACYCALYVSKEVAEGKRTVQAIHERRPPEAARKTLGEKPVQTAPAGQISYPVWRCQVCGYLCARDEPPEVCPVCHAESDRFELFVAKECP